MKRFLLALLLIGGALTTPAKADDSPDLTTSPAWATCKPDVMTVESAIRAAPCVAKTDYALALAFVQWTKSDAGSRALAKVAFDQTRGDGEAAKPLLRQWSAAVVDSYIAVKRMAEKPIASTVFDVPGAPAKLTSCWEEHAVDDPQWIIGARWTPTFATLTAVKIRIETQNAFGDALQTDDLAPTGTYQAGESAYQTWTVGDAHMPARANIAKVRCTIVGTIDATGKTWIAPTPSPKVSSK